MEDYDEGPGTPVKMGHYTVNDTFNFKEDKGVRMNKMDEIALELEAKKYFKSLSPDDRQNFLVEYCTWCFEHKGNKICHCMRDE